MQLAKQLLTIKEASYWATNFLERNISESNISYLLQYGKIKKHNGGSSVYVDTGDLRKYYESHLGQRIDDIVRGLRNGERKVNHAQEVKLVLSASAKDGKAQKDERILGFSRW